MGVMVVALGFAVLFQFIILRIKWNKKQYADVGVDILMLIILNSVFGGSILGVVSATAGSTLISLYLMRWPIKAFESVSIVKDGSTSREDVMKSMMNSIDSLFDQDKGKK